MASLRCRSSSPCVSPSSSTTRRACRQTKSPMYSPMACCRRNLKPAICRPRRKYHRRFSASLAFLRRSLARAVVTRSRRMKRISPVSPARGMGFTQVVLSAPHPSPLPEGERELVVLSAPHPSPLPEGERELVVLSAPHPSPLPEGERELVVLSAPHPSPLPEGEREPSFFPRIPATLP